MSEQEQQNTDPQQLQIPLDIELLRKQKLFVATPMYGGMATGTFCQSMNDLIKVCTANGIEIQYFYLYNESLIQRARNYCADEFLRSDATHLLFIDADISFNPLSVLQLLAVQISDTEKYQIVAGPYPKKTIMWERIAAAAHHEVVNPQNVQQLQYFGGDFVLNFVPGVVNFKMNEPVSVLEAGTGFMLIPRVTLENWKLAYPEMSYKPDHLQTKNFDGSRNIHAFFHCDIDPKTGRYLSEDYYFCQKTIAMGGTIHVCPWMELHHTGSYTYRGSIAALAVLEEALKKPRPSDIQREKELQAGVVRGNPIDLSQVPFDVGALQKGAASGANLNRQQRRQAEKAARKKA